MIKGIENNAAMLLVSGNARELAKFYIEKVGLTLTFRGIVAGNKELFSFEMDKGSVLYIVDGSERLKDDIGHNILNFEVDRIDYEVRKFDDLGVKKIQDPYCIEDLGKVATFRDIEGNYVQLIQHSFQDSRKILN
ncbi:MAG: hypothetical protein M1365_12475 [Actinobacteria bacterium]|nr:hypothetical protein [Actinomycetota bacterium]